ncbi:MAG: FAD-dependent thymidylate synthase [Pseudomonadota bacterium]
MTKFEPITRPHAPYLDEILGQPHDVLDHGFIRVIDYMGDEAAIVQAARVSYGEGTKTPSDDRGLIRYLMRHWHTTPFEMCEIKLHVKLPIFVARQWIRHRTASVNEVSARYSILPGEFYVPAAEDVQAQSKTNKQGRSGEIGPDRAKGFSTGARDYGDMAFRDYNTSLKWGVARELARINLPLSTYTEWYWKVNLHNLMHFLRLRADPHAQLEIRRYAEVICEILQSWLPNVWGAFQDYRLDAVTFSSAEMEVVRRALESVPYAIPADFSKGEALEFTQKLFPEHSSD